MQINISKNNDKTSTLSFFNKSKAQKAIWIIKISVISLIISLLLSLFSDYILTKSNIVFALLLLIIFMGLNIFSDMIGLAITSCQVSKLNSKKMPDDVYEKCILLIKNSDKVSSILCDMIGDVCGVLCGVSSTMITIILSKVCIFKFLGLFLGAIVSSFIVALTVFLKAIAKNYAVRNSSSIVVKSSKFLLYFHKISYKNRKRN